MLRTILSGCIGLTLVTSIGLAELPEPLVPRARKIIEPEIQNKLHATAEKINGNFIKLAQYPVQFRSTVREATFGEPWDGMEKLEALGLNLARSAERDQVGLGEMIVTAIDGLGKDASAPTDKPATPAEGFGPALDYLVAQLKAAHELHTEAITKIDPKVHEFLCKWPLQQVNIFHCQIQPSDRTIQVLRNDRGFCDFALKMTDWSKLNLSAQTLLALAEPDVLATLVKAFESVEPLTDPVEGVEGDVIAVSQTPSGLVIVGGKGKNVYNLARPVALIIDLGGDDTYKGTVAASTDQDHPLGMVIDIAGNDTYQPGPFGLAAGRFGVGILIDQAGNDTYTLAPGCGGVGFAGIGVLYDAAGNDTYKGKRFTLGAALAGVGLLFDAGGDDSYDAESWSMGLGAPGGLGALVDRTGKDSYRCGFTLPSAYNKPGIEKDDPAFQFSGFGMGMGVGRRLMPQAKNGHEVELAGGIGLVVELDGNDSYFGSNFAFGAGYYFGAGGLMDLAGDDSYASARYAHASGAHLGQGLFLDYAGDDTYRSTGPTWTGASAWDHSQCLFVEASGNDTYDWSKTEGLGISHGNSWAVCAELGGDDTYAIRKGPARANPPCLVVFFDQAGSDDYSAAGNKQAGDGKDLADDKKGSLFIDHGE
jgi:hypothetical protein